jgi:hypothetical protein
MKHRTPLAALLLLACLAPAQAALAAPRPAGRHLGHAALVGIYRLQGGPDTVSALELQADGHFRFIFAAGALDLMAEGRWTSDGRSVILNTEPRPVPPVFSAGPVRRSADAPLAIRVANPAGRGLALIDLRVGFADGHVVQGYTQDEGWRPDDEDHVDPAQARWVELSLGMYGLPPQRFALDPAVGNDFAFTLTPNDLGTQDFRDASLAITREGLVLTLLGGSGTFVRQRR